MEQVYFDPEKHPKDTLKAFTLFCKKFDLFYEAKYTDPPKAALDALIQRWTIQNATPATPHPVITLDQYDTIKHDWQSRDKVKKVLGLYGSMRLHSDFESAQPDKALRDDASWNDFKKSIEDFYKPTENLTLVNFQFRSLAQLDGESFTTFCDRISREAKSCSFKCNHQDCTAESIAVRDQIVIGTSITKIREEALLKSWDLNTIRVEGMRIESAIRGEQEISNGVVNKVGKYSRKNLQTTPRQPLICYMCGNKVMGSIFTHKASCPAKNSKCNLCKRIGHFTKCCRSEKDVKYYEASIPQKEDQAELDTNLSDAIYNVNIFRVSLSGESFTKDHSINDFTVELVVNGNITSVTADTGAKVSVCGKQQALNWNLLDRAVPTNVKIKPYNSPTVSPIGKARCAVTFGTISVPVEWYILDACCEPIIAGSVAVHLGIIKFAKNPDIFKPIHHINKQLNKGTQEHLQDVLAKRPNVFSSVLGKHRNYSVKLHVDKDVKPIVTPARPTAYHLVERIDSVIKEMIQNDVIEEHPVGEPAPWVSAPVIVPKSDGSLRVTLDARNVNEAIISSNLPIPKQQDIMEKLGGSVIFSKLDFRSAFWQLELDKESRQMTIFNVNNKLYRYKRLTMGLKPAQGELNAALAPLFAHIPNAHLIHDDLIIGSQNDEQHIHDLDQVLQAVESAGLTLNKTKCFFAASEIKFWGLICNKDGIKPDPDKISALENLEIPKNRTELLSFLCMMQSNSDFIPQFARKAAPLRELSKSQGKFKWEKKHMDCFNDLLQEFREDTLVRYFDKNKPVFIFTDAHVTGLGAILAQGDTIQTAKPVHIKSRTTKPAETRYPPIDLEGLAVDYALRSFRNYLIGSPHEITVVTDHQPLIPIFNGKKRGSLRTERFKTNNQHINFKLIYQKGAKNQSDYLSRKSLPFDDNNAEEKEAAEDINNYLYTLHTTPIIDRITLKQIAEETSKDKTLSRLKQIIETGKPFIPKTEKGEILKFQPFLSEITVTGNGILLKADRIILPEQLEALAIQLAHQGSHPRLNAMERRLRFHFYIPNLKQKIEAFLSSCQECELFTEKKVTEPIKSHKVPSKCWQKVSVDLFGPMPTHRHILVVQDLASRFPAAKLVSSTSSDKVLPALGQIYDSYGNPDIQLSDNGPPFNSSAMKEFANKRDIQLEKIPPLHPSSNPVENFMRPLGKTMKIAHHTNSDVNAALQQLLENYRDTPHPSTGIPPSQMLFRDGMSGTFPYKPLDDKKIQLGIDKDKENKLQVEQKINSSKFKKKLNLTIGDNVLIRNYKKRSKFDPIFLSEPFVVADVRDQGRSILVERITDGQMFLRHPDDLRLTKTTAKSKKPTH